MLFNQTAEYALRAMALLAVRSGEPCLAGELAEAAHIPRHYVSKVMRRLVVAGLVTSKRGRGGGFVLARPASEVRFSEILAATDVVLDGGICAFGLGQCSKVDPCVLHPVWSRLKSDIERWGETTTLADIEQGARLPSTRLPAG